MPQASGALAKYMCHTQQVRCSCASHGSSSPTPTPSQHGEACAPLYGRRPKPGRTHEDGRGIDAAHEAGTLAHRGDHDLDAEDLQEQPDGKVPTALRQPRLVLYDYFAGMMSSWSPVMPSPCLEWSVSCTYTDCGRLTYSNQQAR